MCVSGQVHSQQVCHRSARRRQEETLFHRHVSNNSCQRRRPADINGNTSGRPRHDSTCHVLAPRRGQRPHLHHLCFGASGQHACRIIRAVISVKCCLGIEDTHRWPSEVTILHSKRHRPRKHGTQPQGGLNFSAIHPAVAKKTGLLVLANLYDLTTSYFCTILRRRASICLLLTRILQNH